MKPVGTIFLYGLLLLLLSLINASLSISALSVLNATENTAIYKRNMYIVFGMSVFSAALLIFLLFYTVKNNIVYGWGNVILVLAGFILFMNGILSAYTASFLQCLKSDLNISLAWEYTSLSAGTGIIGAMSAMTMKTFFF